MNLHHLFAHWGDLLSGGVMYGVVAYLLRTMPAVRNPWIAWLIGGLQYAFSNADKGREHFDAAAQQKPFVPLESAPLSALPEPKQKS